MTEQPPSVVIADDEEDVRESTAMLLRSEGFVVATVGDAARILEVVEAHQPDVLLQDLRMPGLSVAGLVASLRANPATAEIPIVFFSANAELAATSTRLASWGYVAKPFAPEELVRALRAAARPAESPLVVAERDVAKEVRTVFHDYWNALCALGTYNAVLRRSDLPEQAARVVARLDDLLLQLEARTDHLRSYVNALVTAVPVGADGPGSPQRTAAAAQADATGAKFNGPTARGGAAPSA